MKSIKDLKDLKYLAYHDSLTGLLNRNWFYKHMDDICCLYVYFIDINDLHIINRKGHTAGDEHIKLVVKSIDLKKNDRLLRYAGDEFILFSDRKDAVETNELFSVGIASMKQYKILDAIHRADTAMIASKLTFKSKMSNGRSK